MIENIGDIKIIREIAAERAPSENPAEMTPDPRGVAPASWRNWILALSHSKEKESRRPRLAPDEAPLYAAASASLRSFYE